ncbi:Eukaryotic translation initiation factor 3 subunit B [Plecturocebus cupreus]
MTLDTPSIYETPSMGLLDKKSLKISGIKDFSWSPGGNRIAFWVPEDKRYFSQGNPDAAPYQARDPSVETVQCGGLQAALSEERRLLVRENEGKTGTCGCGRNERNHQSLCLGIKWKFAVLHGEAPRISVFFYHFKNNGKTELIKTFHQQQANTIFWSPQGQFVVLAGLRSMDFGLHGHEHRRALHGL